MNRACTAETVSQFHEWLRERRPLGLAESESAGNLVIADATDSWTVDLEDTSFSRTVVATILDSGRRAWAKSASLLAVSLSRNLALPVSRFEWINDAATAWSIAFPGEEFPVAGRAAAVRARGVAKLMLRLGQAPAGIRRTIAPSIEIDKLFRPVMARGWSVDLNALAVTREGNASATASASREDGIDLSKTTTDADSAAATAWLAQNGITVTDSEGNPSHSRDDFDNAMIPDTPEGRFAWSRYRTAASRRSARLSLNQLWSNVDTDGLVHSEIIVRGARTGRGKVIGPNLTSLAKIHRNLILASPGHVFVALDLDRMEPSVAAALSGDESLRQALLATDVYEELAVSIWGATARGDKTRRSTAKTCFLGILYGRGAKGLAQQLGISISDAQAIIDRLWAAYPKLSEFVNECRAAASAGNRIYTPNGRPLPKPTKGDYQNPNYLLQGTAADLFYEGIGKVADALGAEVLVLPIHDEILVQVPFGQEFTAAAALESAMAVEFNGVFISGQAKILGRSWGK